MIGRGSDMLTANRQLLEPGSILLVAVEAHVDTNTERSVYCLRHTAICMRIILSHGKVNIFNLAKNAGTRVEQIERFYAKHLPLSRDGKEPAELLGGVRNIFHR